VRRYGFGIANFLKICANRLRGPLGRWTVAIGLLMLGWAIRTPVSLEWNGRKRIAIRRVRPLEARKVLERLPPQVRSRWLDDLLLQTVWRFSQPVGLGTV
jgi:hypothetical protein